jgi:integrase
MPKIKLTDAYLRTLPKSPGHDLWHTDAALAGFVAVQCARGKITFRMRTDKNHTLKVGTWGPALTSADARELAKKKLRQHLLEPVVRSRKITLGKYFDEYYAPQYRLRHTSEKSLNNLNQLQLNDTLLTAITPQMVKAWVNSRLHAGKKPGTVNRSVTALKAVLNHAVTEGWLAANPLARLAKLSEDEHARVRYLTTDERKRFLAALDAREAAIRAWRPSTCNRTFADVVKPLILTAMNTGLRQGELFNLTWEDYADGVITARTRKTKGARIKVRRVPVPVSGCAVLQAWQAQLQTDTGLIFPSPHGGGRMKTIAKSWNDLMRRAEISNFRFHDLRHHYASTLVMRRVDLHTVQMLLGHSDPKMTMRYAHLAPEHLREAVAVLNE